MGNTCADPTEHPAIRTLRELWPSSDLHCHVEVLKPEGRHSVVYRLEGVGQAGSNVIAKRSRMETVALERFICEEVLPHLPVSTPQFYGFVEDPDERFGWLLFEDVGDGSYWPELAEHRALAEQFLATMHVAAATLPAVTRLPERGLQFYLCSLRPAREAFWSNRGNNALTASDVQTLDTLARQFDFLESRWTQMTDLCVRAPRTLVHGDFSTKNVRIRTGRTGPVLTAFDWESAGWAVPAADLARIDPAAYWLLVRDHWPELTIEDTQRLASFGKIFRCLSAIPGERFRLASPWPERAMRKIRSYLTEITDVLDAAGWED